MYKNVIFDFSDTLYKFTAIDHLADQIGDYDRACRIHRKLFAYPLWEQVDYGLLSREEHKRMILPELDEEDRSIASEYLDHWPEYYTDMDGMPELIAHLKSRGIKMYILSNYCDAFEEIYARYDMLRSLDGRLISYEAGMGKASPEFFQMLLDKYDILPETCIFFDDYPENTVTARALGIESHVFTDAQSARVILGL